jgi:PEGA domain
MSIEYLLVTYTEDRAVLADGVRVGFTNRMFLLPADEYSITLSGDGYTPASQEIVLSATSAVKPMVVLFTPVSAQAAPAPSATAASPVLSTREKKKDA